MNKEHDSDRVERATTVTYPVASFTLKRSQIAWITDKAAKLGLSKSAYLREAIDNLMKDDDKEAA